ncbi:hypothetical protein SMACR_05266 [Sordaria macrospora]|uniref:WGS project CABT00000000 data, contig 2.8 n=2 Tax=Sordaria macrospora TaxID=5147 RepID=F7VUX4_SORMK|nr:uncharacterized protein SMAC_05266 [Sordaria macrospora k-hell]KAA8636284.1 hypothetical protein SMACR_05266 [Sordaria macrospora]WPJ57378.1 hypothetical protein SMAC4_05266 [Sordaria macrospora]CCC09320.1 unnamed protein product [Sordaria macrospora k-hell]
MATIEPRLMHLSTVLNTQQADSPSPAQLGPLTTPANNNSLFLPTLPRDAGQHQQQQQQQRNDNQLPTLPPIHTLSNESLAKQTPRIDHFGSDPAARHPPSSYSLQLLLSNSPEASSTSLSSLRRPADDHPDALHDAYNKKRQRALAAKDDYVQLPQPLKKQKSTQEVVLQQVVTVPPILNGLHEPPPNPNASRFPPILSGVDHEPPRISGYMHDLTPPAHIPASTTTTPPAEWSITSPPPTDGDKTSGGGKAKRRAAKPRRKWSDEETNNLLLGVSRHGVGKWTTILEDPDYKFNDRTAGDLKDRFRTCCPEELRSGSAKRSPGVDKSTSGESSSHVHHHSRHKNGLSLDALLSNPEVGPSDKDRGDSDSAPAKQRKSRAHRKKMEDLVELGIRGPFKKSHRRERRPFTDLDDKEILAGLKKHGPAWTKIQRDPEYHLQSRQPTDLRDRVRNKYPAIYASIEKTNPRDKDQQARGSAEASSSHINLLEPSINPTMSKSLEPTIARSIEPQVSRQSSREELPKWLPSTTCDPTETLPGLASVFADMPDGPLPSSYFGGPPDMDISRLLLNDAQDPSASERLRYGQGGMGGGGPVLPGGQDGSSGGPAHRRAL